MIRVTTALLALGVIVATGTTAIAIEPEGWCNCNPEASACRSICGVPDPPVMMQEQGRRPRTWMYQPSPTPRPPTKIRRHHSY
jgi:hypothetical protein